MVATDIAARGIHVDDVALVVHADPPVEHKAYLHRSGRTARAGAAGTVITLMTDEQVRDVRALTRAAGIRPTMTRVMGAAHPVLAQLAPGERTLVAGGLGVPAPEQQSSRRGGGSGRPGRQRSGGSGNGGGGGSRGSRPTSSQGKAEQGGGTGGKRSGRRSSWRCPARCPDRLRWRALAQRRRLQLALALTRSAVGSAQPVGPEPPLRGFGAGPPGVTLEGH